MHQPGGYRPLCRALSMIWNPLLSPAGRVQTIMQSPQYDMKPTAVTSWEGTDHYAEPSVWYETHSCHQPGGYRPLCRALSMIWNPLLSPARRVQTIMQSRQYDMKPTAVTSWEGTDHYAEPSVWYETHCCHQPGGYRPLCRALSMIWNPLLSPAGRVQTIMQSPQYDMKPTAVTSWEGTDHYAEPSVWYETHCCHQPGGYRPLCWALGMIWNPLLSPARRVQTIMLSPRYDMKPTAVTSWEGTDHYAEPSVWYETHCCHQLGGYRPLCRALSMIWNPLLSPARRVQTIMPSPRYDMKPTAVTSWEGTDHYAEPSVWYETHCCHQLGGYRPLCRALSMIWNPLLSPARRVQTIMLSPQYDMKPTAVTSQEGTVHYAEPSVWYETHCCHQLGGYRPLCRALSMIWNPLLSPAGRVQTIMPSPQYDMKPTAGMVYRPRWHSG